MQVVVTGGAGFIGSHLVDALVAEGHRVRVLDDLSTGYQANVNPSAELVAASVVDAGAVGEVLEGAEVLFHHAAARSVLRSVEEPLETDSVNVHGTLTLLAAAHEAGVRRVVSASSSSVYGGSAVRPTPETAPLTPRSPYAVSKLAGEHYCRVFAELYGLETVSLRYFNIYGPRQRPDSAYAAVIPLFIDALLQERRPQVHGDGRQSRGFTYVGDAVAANLSAAHAPADVTRGSAFNVAGEGSHSLLGLLDVLGGILGVQVEPVHTEPRRGDVRHSQALIEKARAELGYVPTMTFEEGLRRTVNWFRSRP